MFWIIGLLLVVAVALVGLMLYRKNIHIWLIAYLRGLQNKPTVDGTKHVLFCFVDHFEPMWRTDDIDVERARVDRWCREYRQMAKQHRDSDGCMPKHTFFYPAEEYRDEHLQKLSALCAEGYGEIEVHLHHDNDTADNFCQTMKAFVETLHYHHGALPFCQQSQQIKYAFIHGNWALDNSRCDGQWCGLDNELKLLQQTGCYVDMTLPSAPSETQTKKINSIYYASSVTGRCKNHNDGTDVEVNVPATGDLMLIQGPLGFNWQMPGRKFIPNIENGDVRKSLPPLPSRVDLWVDAHIHVKGRPEWIFVKVHTHGTQEPDMDTLLGKARDDMHRYLEQTYNDGTNYQLHYVSAREMYNIAKAAEAGKQGNPHDYRDFLLAKPSFRQRSNQEGA
ncbi:hypothetical protein QWY77_06560 [Thalassotalea ponticola]|uniref:hypothetical protein n=1 Tax=Thalassotalea ponticola TaxID=1523392 RepID=UPI0025B2C038|nr:hypothetical protein [Thalassotalea ponticola]MDN3652424.1 hypothetical protein [Thalassotalea ponticola]